MAGFFPHVGISYGDYTALSMSTPKSILDDIVADISGAGGTVNGWSVYRDLRNSTGTLQGFYVHNNGRWTNTTTGNNSAWTFTSGSPFFVGGTTVGYATPLSLPVYNTGTASMQISVDGTTWYSASYYSWAGFAGMSTGSLDRPYAGSTGNTANLLFRCPSTLVLKCASTSSRDFYIELSMPASGNSPTGLLMVRPWELYPAASGGTAANYGCIDSLKIGTDFYGAATGSDLQYVMCLYPDAFCIWVATAGSAVATMYYAGNLDTVTEGAAISADKGAMWYGCTDNTYSGILKNSGDLPTTQFKFWGNSMMNRSVNELQAGNDMAAGHNEIVRKNATYQIKARGRAYCDWPWQSSVNYDGKVELLPLDVYNAGYSSTTYYSGDAGCYGAREQYRGTLKYLKTFSTCPASKNLVTHPAAGGVKYLCLRAGHNANGRGGTTPYRMHEDFMMSNDAPSAFSQPGIIMGPISEFYMGASAVAAYGSYLRYFAIPIL